MYFALPEVLGPSAANHRNKKLLFISLILPLEVLKPGKPRPKPPQPGLGQFSLLEFDEGMKDQVFSMDVSIQEAKQITASPSWRHEYSKRYLARLTTHITCQTQLPYPRALS